MKRFFQIVATALLCIVAYGSLPGTGDASDRTDLTAPDPLNATYWIEGDTVALVDGRCERAAAQGSAMKVRTTVWQQPVYGDLDGDGDGDTALVLIHSPGGSGTFYYVAAAINVTGRYHGTKAILLGDRIKPKDLAIRQCQIVVDYADRRPNEPFRTPPSVDRTIGLMLQNGQLSVSPSPNDQGHKIDRTKNSPAS